MPLNVYSIIFENFYLILSSNLINRSFFVSSKLSSSIFRILYITVEFFLWWIKFYINFSQIVSIKTIIFVKDLVDFCSVIFFRVQMNIHKYMLFSCGHPFHNWMGSQQKQVLSPWLNCIQLNVKLNHEIKQQQMLKWEFLNLRINIVSDKRNIRSNEYLKNMK